MMLEQAESQILSAVTASKIDLIGDGRTIVIITGPEERREAKRYKKNRNLTRAPRILFGEEARQGRI
jgi:hypothetical protein